MASTTTLKLPPVLKTRVTRLAKRTRRSAHSLMVEAIERHVDYEERMRAFVVEALAADRGITRTGEVYRADDVHAWIERLARSRRATRPKPWRR
jgi:predicted transcriptional regulator